MSFLKNIFRFRSAANKLSAQTVAKVSAQQPVKAPVYHEYFVDDEGAWTVRVYSRKNSQLLEERNGKEQDKETAKRAAQAVSLKLLEARKSG